MPTTKLILEGAKLGGDVSVNNWPEMSEVCGSVTISNFPSFPAVQAVSGPLTDAQLRAAPIPVSIGTVGPKTDVLRPASLVTTTTTADQPIFSYTVPAGKNFYLGYIFVNARLTVFGSGVTFFGTASLDAQGTKLGTWLIAGMGMGVKEGLTFNEPPTFPAGTVLRVICTPSAITSFTWQVNFGGYEKAL